MARPDASLRRPDGAATRPRRGSTWPAVLAVVLLALLGGVADSRADEKTLHTEGMKALAQGRFAEAEGLFRRALAEDPEENAGRFFSTTYLPHYFLGVALAEQDRCAEALEAWGVSTGQGKVQRTDYGEQITRRIGECEARLTQIQVAQVEAEQALERARRGARVVQDLAAKKELRQAWDRGQPSLAERQTQADRQIAEATRTLERGARESNETLLQEATVAAAAAASMLTTVEEEARERLGQINAAAAESLSARRAAEEAAERLLASVAPLAPYPPQLGAQVQKLKNLLADIDKARGGARAEEIDQGTDQIIAETRALRRRSGGPPRSLGDAATAFLAGEVEEALRILDQAELSGERSRWHALILQAASRYHLFLSTGGQVDSLAAAAAADIEAALALGDRHGNPSETYLSPRFLEFYRSTRSAYEAAADAAAEQDPVADEGA